MRILVTGVAGMIGSYLVDALISAGHEVIGVDIKQCKPLQGLTGIVADIGDAETIESIIDAKNVDRIIHLAALAHTAGEKDLSYEKYYYINVECAKNIFKAAKSVPVLFISTVDVYGFTNGVVNLDTEIHPVTSYGKTKALAEEECKKECEKYTIFRLSPVYTPEIRRDIQKRYYLKYPNIAYIIGKGTEYEILNIEEAVRQMKEWCNQKVVNEIRIIKDKDRMNTVDYIKQEKEEGRAKCVLHFPKWLVTMGYIVLKFITGKNKYTYLLSKAVNPMRSESIE